MQTLRRGGDSRKVKKRFMNAKIVIPGHSTIGDNLIFDHTIKIAEMN